MRSSSAGHPRSGTGRRCAVSFLLSCVSAVVLVGSAWAAPDDEAVSPTPCAVEVKACARLSDRTAWLTDGEGDLIAGPIPMNHGGTAAPTPTGDFAVQWKNIDHFSSESEGIPMPYSVFFDGNGRAFHFGDIRSNSAGCIRLPREAAQLFYSELQPGDRVEILP